jgi:PAS domain S-box-containing protein
MTSNNVHSPVAEDNALVGAALTTVHRIDWSKCTILPADSIPPAVVEPNHHPLVKNFLDGLHLDEAWPLYVASSEGAVLYVNGPYRTLSSLCETVSASLHSPQLGRASAPLMSILKDVLALEQGMTLQEKVRIEGRTRYFRSHHFPVVDKMGKVVALAGIYVDCTKEAEGMEAARQAQQRFQDFARASSDWYWETDRDGRITLLSDRFTALVGVPSVSLMGRPLTALGQVLPPREGGQDLVQSMASARAFRDHWLEVTGRDGAVLTFQLSGVPVFDTASGEFTGFRGVGMDITSRIAAERRAEEMRQSLENTLEELTNKNIQLDIASSETARALKVKSDFLAAMSHELRTPLNAIIGFAEAMQLEVFGELNTQYKNYSKDIMNAGRHLLELINDVLDVAVIESRKVKLDLETIPLADIVDAALNLVIIRANQKSLDMSEARVSPKWQVTVDVRRATQVFVNLFSNAVKFTPERGRIGVEVTPAPDNCLAVTIWDTGIGIPLEKQEMLFEKFQQVNDDIYSRKQEGTGLGLHISRELARLMGGDITMTSVPGEGSRFTVTLPRAD